MEHRLVLYGTQRYNSKFSSPAVSASHRFCSRLEISLSSMYSIISSQASCAGIGAMTSRNSASKGYVCGSAGGEAWSYENAAGVSQWPEGRASR